LMPHCLYYARAFAGDALDMVVRAWSEKRVPESAFDELLVDMQGSQARARITLTLSTRPERNTVTLRGTKATVVVDTNLVTTVLVRDRALPAMVAKSIAAADPAWQLLRCTLRNTLSYAVGAIRAYPDIRNTLRAFYGALQGHNPLPATGEDGLAVVEMMERVRRLAEADLDGKP
jgi:predicted dehydrogenase